MAYSAKNSQALVAANTDHDGDRYLLFEKTLQEGRLRETLEAARVASGKTKAAFFVVIKPNISMMLRRADIGTYTDTFFVIHLLRLLVAAGYTHLAVVESGNLYGNWFENRSVVQVAARAGYFDESIIDNWQGEARKNIHVRGQGVDALVPLVDLSLETGSHNFGDETAPVGQTWMDADFRISISGLKAHFYSHYTAAIKNIYGCLPEPDKVAAYHCRRKVGPWTARLIHDFPVGFSVVVAYSAADGWMGVKMKAIFNKPHTIIAGADIQAVDNVCARLIGLAPGKSILYRCLADYSPPRPYLLTGNARPFKKWRNVPAFLPLFSWLIEANANIMDFGGSIATGGNDACFPVKVSSRSGFKKILYYLSFPVSFFCDIGIVQLNWRRWRFFRKLGETAGKTPQMMTHSFILERLELFSDHDLKVLIDLLRQQPRQKVTFSGHVVFIDGRKIEWRNRLTPAVLGAVEIMNYVRETFEGKGFMKLAAELATLREHQPRLFDSAQPYPYCYR